MVEHFGAETSGVGASTEAKEVDVVSRRVVAHQETIASHDVIGESGANCRIFCLVVPGFETSKSCMLERIACDIGTNAGLVVVETVCLLPVKHSVDLQDITVLVCASKIVPGTVEA